MIDLKSLSILWVEIAEHLDVSPRSITTFRRRLAEGLTFLTITMPSLGKAVEAGISTGRFECPTTFKRMGSTQLPQFLYEHFSLVFDKDGYVLDDPTSLRTVRQLTLLFYKLETPLTPEGEELASKQFIERDMDVKIDNPALKNAGWPLLTCAVHHQIHTILDGTDPFDVRCHHSNGATADSFTNIQKREVRRYIPKLWEHYAHYFFADEYHARAWYANNSLVITNPPAKVTWVPKDSRGPRTICMEPHERMFVQKGLMQQLYDHIESVSPAKGFINFTDQTVNRRIAQTSSVTRAYATIDMKDASDLVSWDLVKRVFPRDWVVALEATRSDVADVKGTLHRLRKFAPMGSALCFPVEALIFYGICKTVTSEVWVYGDDIIVPTEKADLVMSTLENYGLKVNLNKSLVAGFFRESCGGDYYKGVPIDYIKYTSSGFVETVAFANLISERYPAFDAHGLVQRQESLHKTIIRRAPTSQRHKPQPLVFYTDRLAGNDAFLRRRYNKLLQRYEVRCLTAQSKKQTPKISEYDLYFDWLTNSSQSSKPHNDSLFKEEWDEDRPGLLQRRYLDLLDPKIGSGGFARPVLKFAWVPQGIAH